jgi:hypothetical protein
MLAKRTRQTARVGRIVVACATLSLSASVGYAQPSRVPAEVTISSRGLAIEAAPSPSAGSLAPVANCDTAAGRVDRLRRLVRGASCSTMRPSMDGELQFANRAPARVPLNQDASWSERRWLSPIYSTPHERSTTPQFESTDSVEFSIGSTMAGRPESLSLDTSREGKFGSASPVSGFGGSWSNAHGVPSVGHGAPTLQGLGAGLPQAASTPITPLATPAAQPFSSRIVVPSGAATGLTDP